MVREIILNRKGQKIVAVVERAEDSRGLVFVMHGLGGSKDQQHIETMADVFKEKCYTVVKFDTTNTFGESDGEFIEATLTNYYEDLEDVIGWASGQEWYIEPFILVGHSLGGISSLLYAEKFPEKVKALAPISTVVSGKLSLMEKDKEMIEKWEKEGMREWMSHSGRLKRLPWSHVVDRLKYDVFPEIHKIVMPVLLAVGENDESTPVDQHELLYDKLSGKKELHIIKGSKHTFRTEGELEDLGNVLGVWVDGLEPVS